MKVLICGGRDLNRHECWNWLERNLHDYLAEATGCYSLSISHIIQGGARGADEGAKDWAKSEGITCMEFCADWKTHGKAAGPIRNRKMLDEGRPDIVVALPGGKGTANMINQAQARGVPVIEVDRI
jgi:hypothetical protein